MEFLRRYFFSFLFDAMFGKATSMHSCLLVFNVPALFFDSIVKSIDFVFFSIHSFCGFSLIGLSLYSIFSCVWCCWELGAIVYPRQWTHAVVIFIQPNFSGFFFRLKLRPFLMFKKVQNRMNTKTKFVPLNDILFERNVVKSTCTRAR